MTIIRPARPWDREFVLAMADRLVSFDVPAFRTKDELAHGDRRALGEWFQAPKADEALFVAELDGRQAGCAYLVTLVDYFNDRPHAAERRADAGANECQLRQWRVAHALRSELLEQALGHRVGAAIAADILAHQEHPGIRGHRLAMGIAQRLAVAGLGAHRATSRRVVTSRVSCSTGSQVPFSANATASSTSAAA